MKEILFAIRSYPWARVLDVMETWDEACDTIAAWEDSDIQDGVYSPGRYYITPITRSEVDQIETANGCDAIDGGDELTD